MATIPISGDPTISGVVLAEQAATPTSPAVGKRKLFVTTAGVARLVDSAGAASDLGLADGSVTTVKLAAGAVTDVQVHALNKDGVAALPSMRTLGSAATQAAAGNHVHAGATADAGIAFTLGDGVAAIVAGTEPDQWLEVPFPCTIVAARLLADAAGAIVCDLWRSTYAGAPPTVAGTITASAKPTLSSAVKAELTTLTGWSTALAKGDWLRVHVDSAATVKRVVLSLALTR
jgi:hypothetical protein